MTHPALLRLPVLLRVWHIKGHLKEWENGFRLSHKGWFLVGGVAYLMLLHLVACAYFSLTYVEGFGSGENGQESWLPTRELEVNLCVDHSDGMMYYYSSGHSNASYTPAEAHAVGGYITRALYFGATMLTTLGKTVEPSSTLQCSPAGEVVPGFLVVLTPGAVASDLLNELPETIKRPLLRSMCQSALRTLSLLADVRPSLDALEQVFIDNVQFILYGQGEIIYRHGDYASGLFFLLEGELIIIIDGGCPSHYRERRSLELLR
ncbi:Cyclic nucleotide-binding-like [Phytophthora cactorum]|nr:Cyclic nucleotide-binding-like [Phytophthora cactorum]